MLYNTENPHGGDIYEGGVELDFSANTNPFGVPECVKAAVISCLDDLSRYPDPYCRRLIRSIAEHENVPKEFILCGSGAAELIYSFAAAVRPNTAAELAPTFAEYSLSLENSSIIRHCLAEEKGFAVTKDFLDFIEKNKPDAVFLCNPNNPTGLCADDALIEQTAIVCKRMGARLFLDECFMDLSDSGKSFVSKLSIYPNVIVLKAFTKSYGMAGLRLGYCITADKELLKAMSRAVQPWNVSTAAQEAGAAAINDSYFIEKTKALIAKERPRLAVGLKKLGLAVFPSNVNFLLVKGEAGLDKRLLEKGIKIRNCSNYHGLDDSFYRIAVKLPEQNDRLIQAVKEAL